MARLVRATQPKVVLQQAEAGALGWVARTSRAMTGFGGSAIAKRLRDENKLATI
jgi:hypothetical protein